MSFTLSKELEELQKELQENIDLKMRLAEVDALLNYFHSEKNTKRSTKKEIKKINIIQWYLKMILNKALFVTLRI